MTGHGSYKTYTKRIGKEKEDNCIYCGLTDTAEHTVLHCVRWEAQRQTVAINLGKDISKCNIIEEMLDNKEKWKVTHTFIREVMKTKETEKRKNQEATRGV